VRRAQSLWKLLKGVPPDRLAGGMVCTVTLAVLALNIRTLTLQSLWFDEGLSVAFAARPLSQVISTLIHQDLHPPLYYLVLHWWMALAGNSEWAVRMPSALAAVLLVPLAYATVREVSGGPRESSDTWAAVAVAAATFIGASPFLAYYAQEARMYSTAATLSLAALWAFLRAARRQDSGSWGLFGLLLAAGAYTQYFSAFLVPAFLLYAIVLDRRLLRNALGSTILAFVLYLPWLKPAYLQIGRLLRVPDYWVSTSIDLSQFAQSLSDAFLPNVSTALGLAGVVAAIGLVLRFAHQRNYRLTPRTRRGALVFLTLMIPLLLTYATVAVAPKFAARYTITVTAPAYLCAIMLLHPVINHRAKWARGLLCLAAVAVLTVSLRSMLAVIEGRENPRDDVRALAAYLTDNAQAEDAILLVENAPYALQYYYRGQAPVVGLHVGVGFDPAVQFLNRLLGDGPRRVWLVLWHHEFADPSDLAVTELLRAGREAHINERFRGHQLRAFDISHDDQTQKDYAQPQTPMDAGFSPGLRLRGFDLFSNAPGQVHYVFYWEAQKQLVRNHRLTLTLQDLHGTEYLRTDQALCTDYFLPPAWPIGTVIRGRVDLDLPADLPAIEYETHLQVFDPVAQQNLDLVDERGAPQGQKLLVDVLVLPKSTMDGPILEIRNPVQKALGSGLLLRGYDVPGETLDPGETLKLTLWLQRKGTPSVDAAVQFRLQNAAQSTVWETSSPILHGYSPIEWNAEEINRAIYTLLLPPELSGGTYSLQVSIGQTWTALRTLNVTARDHVYDRPPMQQSLDLQYEQGIILLGYDVETHGVSEDLPAKIRLYWQAQGPVNASYKVSVQALLADKSIASQSDTIPVAWSYPTTAWLPGEIVTDEHLLRIDPGVEPGNYSLIVVLYEEQSGERLQVEQAGAVADHAALSTLQIAP
jgi:mannosyltransferase